MEIGNGAADYAEHSLFRGVRQLDRMRKRDQPGASLFRRLLDRGCLCRLFRAVYLCLLIDLVFDTTVSIVEDILWGWMVTFGCWQPVHARFDTTTNIFYEWVCAQAVPATKFNDGLFQHISQSDSARRDFPVAFLVLCTTGEQSFCLDF